MTIERAIDEIAAGQDGLIHGRQLRTLGRSGSAIDRRVASGRLVRITAGVFRVAGAPTTWRQTVRAAVMASGPTAVASHLTAGHLLGLEGCPRPEGRPEILVARLASGSRQLARVHQALHLPRPDLIEVEGLPTTRVERRLLDLAAAVPRSRLETVLDAALRDGRTARHRLLARLRRTEGRAGTATLLHLLGEGPRPESWLERRLLELLRRGGVPAPERQRVLRFRDGRTRRIDLSWLAGQLLVEVSGQATHSTRRERQRDRERANQAVLDGRTILELTYEDVDERPDHVIDVIRAAFQQVARAVRSGSSAGGYPERTGSVDGGSRPATGDAA